MSWFKKSYNAKDASQNNRSQEQHKRVKKTHQTSSKKSDKSRSVPVQNLSKSLCTLREQLIEVVDPEDFFHDPEHVRNYKAEEQFLRIMSEWEIIEHPSRIGNDNFFSADFEDELLQMKTQSPANESNAHNSSSDSLDSNSLEVADAAQLQQQQLAVYELLQLQQQQRLQCKGRFRNLFFGNAIQTGIALPKRQRLKKNSHNFKKSLAETEIIKPPLETCAIDRSLLKTEALAGSIMGAIGRCPDRDGTPRSSETDLPQKLDDSYHPALRRCCDHYDIKQFFRLDDNGNILLNMTHIEESQIFDFAEMQNKRLYRKLQKEAHSADESYCQRRSWIQWLKQLLMLLWNFFNGHPRNKINPYGAGSGPGDTVRAYTLQLALDQSSTFARNIENFISCTKESREAAPQVVMRNMRQFMNGMKNYLVKHGEGKFQQEVETARSRLKSDEFLNLDAILETVMHQLVVLPLREHLYGMFVDYYTRSEDIQLLAQNVKYACGRSAADFGIRSSVTPPTSSSLHVISNLLLRLQEAELPLEKLDLFLCVISTIFDATGCPRGQQLGADDFLPILVFVVAKCGFVGAEIEAEFMWGLLQPTLLNGEPGYYLTALCSAVHVLKSFMASENESGTGSLDWRASSLPACSSVLRVIIPDECNGSLQTRTLPVRPHTTTREVCRIIAHKARITNPQDYALFKLVDGEETPLSETECPQDIRLSAKGKHCMLAYKRIDAKIAWPTAAQPAYN